MKIKHLNTFCKFFCCFILVGATSCVSTSGILESVNYSFVRSENNPIIYPDMEGLEGVLGKNINGPSVIKVPKWVENPLGEYYMYFADHHGKYIRLAYANSPIGPWTIYKPGVLPIDETAAKGHIASPDAIIDEESKTIRMYFHGYNQDKSGQKTFVSTSKDGLNFIASETILGPSYFRVFKYKSDYYALVSGTFYHSKDGVTPFEKGAKILPNARHTAVALNGDKLMVFYSQKGDAPERILKCEVNLSDGTWESWKASAQEEVLKPEMDYEGVNLPIQESVSGFSKVPVHELRDPAIFIDRNDVYLYYSISGEFGIAVAKLKKSTKSTSDITKNESNTMDLYLCIGQSNMSGRATIELQDQDTLQNVFLFTGNEEKLWEKAANPFNKYSTVRKELRMQKLSPSYGFAKEMARATPEKKIGLIVNAKGGTSIEEWKPGDTLYNEAISQTKKAMKYGVLKGIIWHQGESNTGRYDTYMPKITELIEALRTDLNAPNVPFVAGQLSPDKPQRINFNNMILDLPNQVKNTGVVTTENTSTIDDTHFDSASQRLLGKRYAIEMLKLILNK